MGTIRLCTLNLDHPIKVFCQDLCIHHFNLERILTEYFARKQIKGNAKDRQVADPYTSVREYLTGFSVSNAQKIFDKWVALEQLLLVKFIDGNVKAQNEDGSFVTNEHTDCIPAKISQPGYTAKWKEAVAKDHGKIVEVR